MKRDLRTTTESAAADFDFAYNSGEREDTREHAEPTHLPCPPELARIIAETGAEAARRGMEQAALHQAQLAATMTRLRDEREAREREQTPRQWAWQNVRDRWAG